jgi:hypothetical protein
MVADRQSFWPEIERAARALNRSNLAVYPVDARGLLTPAEFSPERGSMSNDTPVPRGSVFQTMQALASRTGGKAFFNNNDLGRALQQAQNDSRVTYVLGYQPSHTEWNGRFREIKVRVSRSGVRLRHRSGYFAQPEESADPGYRDAALGAAKWNPIDASRLGLTVRVYPTGSGALDLDLELDARDVLLRQEEGSWRGDLDVWLVQIGAKDREVRTITRSANIRLPESAYERVRKSGTSASRSERKRARKHCCCGFWCGTKSRGTWGRSRFR